jgi:hypothetical protein
MWQSLKTYYKFPYEIRDPCRARLGDAGEGVCIQESFVRLQAPPCGHELEPALANTNHINRACVWSHWYAMSGFRAQTQARRAYGAAGHGVTKTLEQIAGKQAADFTRKDWTKDKEALQSIVREQLRNTRKNKAEELVRHPTNQRDGSYDTITRHAWPPTSSSGRRYAQDALQPLGCISPHPGAWVRRPLQIGMWRSGAGRLHRTLLMLPYRPHLRPQSLHFRSRFSHSLLIGPACQDSAEPFWREHVALCIYIRRCAPSKPSEPLLQSPRSQKSSVRYARVCLKAPAVTQGPLRQRHGPRGLRPPTTKGRWTNHQHWPQQQRAAAQVDDDHDNRDAHHEDHDTKTTMVPTSTTSRQSRR